MCFCCCCGCCDNQTTKCVEIQIFLFSLINLISSIIGFSIIKWSHISQTCLVFWFLLAGFSLLELFFSVLIIVWRVKSTINLGRNSCAICLARLGLVFTIFSFFMAIIAETMSKDNLNTTDHPCQYLEKILIANNTNPNIILFNRLRQLDLMTQEEKEALCKDVTDPDQYIEICSKGEHLIAYISPSIFEFCSFLLLCFWYQDQRRLRARIDGPMTGKTEERAEMSRRNRYGYNDPLDEYGYGAYGGGINYDLYGRPVFPEQSIGSHVVNVQSSGSSQRFSCGNMNFSRFGQSGGGRYANRRNSSINESAGEEASNNGSSINNGRKGSNDKSSIESNESNNLPPAAPNDIVIVSSSRKNQARGKSIVGKGKRKSILGKSSEKENSNGNSNSNQKSNGRNEKNDKEIKENNSKNENENNVKNLGEKMYQKPNNPNNISMGTNVMSMNQSSGNNYNNKTGFMNASSPSELASENGSELN